MTAFQSLSGIYSTRSIKRCAFPPSLKPPLHLLFQIFGMKEREKKEREIALFMQREKFRQMCKQTLVRVNIEIL